MWRCVLLATLLVADSKLACLSGLMLGGPYEGSGLALHRFGILESVQTAWFGLRSEASDLVCMALLGLANPLSNPALINHPRQTP